MLTGTKDSHKFGGSLSKCSWGYARYTCLLPKDHPVHAEPVDTRTLQEQLDQRAGGCNERG